MNALALATQAKRPSLDDLLGRLTAEEALHNADADVPVNALKMTDRGHLEVPGLGQHALTEWSRDQLARVLGCSWDRWFCGTSPAEQADELNRRLARASGLVRLRTTRKLPEGVEADGVLRAVVSREYTSVADTVVAGVLRDALVGVEEDVRVLRASVTNLSTSFVVKIGEPYKVGGPGNVGEVWGCLMVRNSGVGFAKLVVTAFLHRLVCKNGMALPIGDAALVNTKHRGLNIGEIRAALVAGLDGIADKIHRGANVLAYAGNYRVEDVAAEVRSVLKDAGLSMKLLSPVMAAYDREPHASRFGVSQALTLAAQDESPEVRFALEQAAGLYVGR